MAKDDIAAYGDYLAEEKHASQNTICSYLRDVTQFSEYLAEHQGCGLRQADGTMVQDYMAWMRGRGKSAASVTRFLASVKSFYNFLLDAGAVEANPAKGIPAGRFGDPEKDIGRTAVFLCSEDAKYISGETITMQGGSGLRP